MFTTSSTLWRLLAPLAVAALLALCWTTGRAGAGGGGGEKAKEIEKLIEQLGEDDDEKRMAAEQKLVELGDPAHEAVRKAMREHPDADVKLRARALEKRFHDVLQLVGHTKTVRYVAVSKDGKRALTCGQDKTVRLWDLTGKGKEIKTLEGHKGFVWQVAFVDDEKQALSSGGSDKAIWLWDLDKGEVAKRYGGFPQRVRAMAVSPDEKYVAGGEAGEGNNKDEPEDAKFDVHLFDKKTGELALRLKGHTGYVWRAAFSPNGKRLATAGMNDGTFRVWDIETGRAIVTGKDAHDSDFVTDVVFSKDNKSVFTCGWDVKVKRWDAETGKLIKTYEWSSGKDDKGEAVKCEAIALSPDGNRLLATEGKAVAVLDVESGKMIQRYENHKGDVCAVTFLPDGNKAMSGGKDNVVRMWRVATK
jgi:WD40 repeat protein